MRVTKFEHATMVLEKGGEALVIDPGSFLSATEFRRVAGIVVTHEHADHWTPEHLTRILADNPGARVLGPAGVAAAIAASAARTPSGDPVPVETVAAGETAEVGPFRLAFFGGRHAVIHSSIPVIDNLGVLVDEAFYYPGDSFAEPGVPVDVLAAPVGAPWLKISEAMDFVLAVAPRRAFGAHEMTLSVAGKTLGAQRLAWAVEQGGGSYADLQPGEELEL